MNNAAVPLRDPVSEIFDAVLQARRTAPAGRGDWNVAVRSRTGQLMARFTLGSREQVLAFAQRMEPLGYRMVRDEGEAGEHYEFAFERRAANEAVDHPRRRRGD